MRTALTLLLVAALALASTVDAVLPPPAWMFVGQVDYVDMATVDPGLVATFPTGAPVSVSLAYKPGATEQASSAADPNIGQYLLPYPTSLTNPAIDVGALIAGRSYYLPTSGASMPVNITRSPATIDVDGSLSEKLAGALVTTANTWKPRALDIDAAWFPFAFASDALPTTIPHYSPNAAFVLHLRTCANTAADPCPGGVMHTARVHGSFFTARPALWKPIDVTPAVNTNVITLSSSAPTPIAILGFAHFEPDIVVDQATIRVSQAPPSRLGCSATDVNSDGYTDLLCQIHTPAFRPRAGENAVRLVAKTIDGNYILGVKAVTFLP